MKSTVRHGFLFSFVAISSGNGHQVGRLVDVLTFFNCSQPIFGQWSIPWWQAFSFSPLPLVVYPSIFAAEGCFMLCFLQTAGLSLFSGRYLVLHLPSHIWMLLKRTLANAENLNTGTMLFLWNKFKSCSAVTISGQLNYFIFFCYQYLSVHIRHITYLNVIF